MGTTDEPERTDMASPEDAEGLQQEAQSSVSSGSETTPMVSQAIREIEGEAPPEVVPREEDGASGQEPLVEATVGEALLESGEVMAGPLRVGRPSRPSRLGHAILQECMNNPSFRRNIVYRIVRNLR